jgi:four helix bundle protein
MGTIRDHRDLIIYKKAYEAAMEVFQISRGFPKEENYALTDQVRRSSRSVAANIAEAFRRRLYPKMFIAKLIDSESEAAETQVWLDFSHDCNYIDKPTLDRLSGQYEEILKISTGMRSHPERWQPF